MKLSILAFIERNGLNDDEDGDGDDTEKFQGNGNGALGVNNGDADKDADMTDASSEMGQPDIVPERDDAKIILTEHIDEALAVAGSPTNASTLISGGMDDVGMIWDLETQTCLAKVDGVGDSVSTVSFSADGKYAALGSENGSLSIVSMEDKDMSNADSQATSSALEGPSDTIHFLAWHPRGPVLLAGCADRATYMWHAAKGKFMMAFVGHEDAVTCGGFTSDGKLIVTGSNDSSVRVWNPTTGESIHRIQSGMSGLNGTFHTADIQCIAVGRQDTIAEHLIFSGCAAGDVFISHKESGQFIAQLPRHQGGVECIAVSPTRQKQLQQHTFVATAGADGTVRIWDIANSIERCTYSHPGVIVKVVWHPHKLLVASASSQGSVMLFDVLKAQPCQTLLGHTRFITDICFTMDGMSVASTSADGTVRVYDVHQSISTIE